jgi:hypothetical protein
MIDDYKPVTASDLKPGDEVEVVFRGRVTEYGDLSLNPSHSLPKGDFQAAHTIRRKSRPIGVGDRVQYGGGKSGEVLAARGQRAWVMYDDSAEALVNLSDLTRVTP